MRKAVSVALAMCLALALSGCTQAQADGERLTDSLDAKDKPLGAEVYVFDPGQDLQLPELPTGCEATATATLLRMHGISATKTEVADAMPKSDIDFVHSFLGDPYKPTGGCCMALCSAETARPFLAGTGLTCYQVEGLPLIDLPKPCVIWATIDLAEPQAIKQQGAYTMYYPSHCIVVTSISGGYAQCIDPLVGRVDYPLDRLVDVYQKVGTQAIYVGKE